MSLAGVFFLSHFLAERSRFQWRENRRTLRAFSGGIIQVRKRPPRVGLSARTKTFSAYFQSLGTDGKHNILVEVCPGGTINGFYLLSVLTQCKALKLKSEKVDAPSTLRGTTQHWWTAAEGAGQGHCGNNENF